MQGTMGRISAFRMKLSTQNMMKHEWKTNVYFEGKSQRQFHAFYNATLQQIAVLQDTRMAEV